MTIVRLKTCTKCGATSPATTEFFYMNGRYLAGRCRACAQGEAREHYTRTAGKACALKKERYAADPEKYKVKALRQYAENREAVLAQHKTPEVQQRRRAWAFRWYWADPEAARKRSREYRLKNIEAARIQSRKARVKRRGAQGSHTKADVRLKFAQQKGLCYWCQSRLGQDYEVDHIIALARGGTDNASNICCACMSCNRRKNAKMPWDFTGRLL